MISLYSHAAAASTDGTETPWIRTIASPQELPYLEFTAWSDITKPYLEAIETGDRTVIRSVWTTLNKQKDLREEKFAFLLKALSNGPIAFICVSLAQRYRPSKLGHNLLPADITLDEDRSKFWYEQALGDPLESADKEMARLVLDHTRRDPAKEYSI